MSVEHSEGDIIHTYIDTISSNGISICSIRAEKSTDINGNEILIRGKKARRGIGVGDFSSESEFRAAVRAAVKEVMGSDDELISAIAERDCIIDEMKRNLKARGGK